MSSATASLVGKSKDLVYEILNRLPLTSVIRFRLVCKEWHSLASTQFFIGMHQNINQSPPCFVVQYFNYSASMDYSLDCTTKKSDHLNTLFLNLDDDNNNNNNDMKMNLVREYMNLTYYDIKLISSCRGFLLFTAKRPAASNMLARFRHWLTKDEEDDHALILYNPVTKEKHTVTAPLSSYVYCGFYYHSLTNEYRILYQLKLDPHDHEYEAGFVKFLVFGLQTKSTRVLKVKVNNITSYYYRPDTSTPPVISNGSLHWIGSEDNRCETNLSCSQSILSFGIESEEFHTMPHPPLSHTCDRRESFRHRMNLLEMDGGTLCLCDGYGRWPILLEIYVMEDYKKWTWIRRYRIDLTQSFMDLHKNNRPSNDYSVGISW